MKKEITINPQKVNVDMLSKEAKYIHQLILIEDRRGYIFLNTQLSINLANELERLGYGIEYNGGNNYRINWAF